MEFVVTGRLATEGQGSVQMQVLTTKPATTLGLVAGKSESAQAKGKWSDNNLRPQLSVPVIVGKDSPARPTFAALRADMQEEAVRFFIDLFQENRSVLSLLDADHTFVSASLAEHYSLNVKPASAHHPSRRLPPPVLPQAPRLCPRPRRAAFRQASD